jgi:hypothetical protein
MRSLLILTIACLVGAHGVLADPVRAAFLGFAVVDMSLGANHEAEDARARMIGERLVQTLSESGRYAFVDTAPVEDDIEGHVNVAHCNGCDSAMAARLGADVAITGEVQKTSNLILHMSVYVRDVASGRLVAGGSADMRGNTDESWRRGVDFIVKRRLLGE